MTGLRQWPVETLRRIRNTGAERHVRAAAIVVAHPQFQRPPQMRFRQRDETVQTLAPNGPDDSLTDCVGGWAARRALQHSQSKMFDGFVRFD